jgi:predicted aspartyl protease
MEISVRIVDQRPIATLTLNGTEVQMLVDSGAFYSLLTASTATQLKLPLRSLPLGVRVEGYTGRIEAKMTRVEKMGLRGVQLNNVEFIVGGNELGAGIMGVLGRNILSMADTEYDLAHGAVRISLP